LRHGTLDRIKGQRLCAARRVGLDGSFYCEDHALLVPANGEVDGQQGYGGQRDGLRPCDASWDDVRCEMSDPEELCRALATFAERIGKRCNIVLGGGDYPRSRRTGFHPMIENTATVSLDQIRREH
jgi:hypothetical protein